MSHPVSVHLTNGHIWDPQQGWSWISPPGGGDLTVWQDLDMGLQWDPNIPAWGTTAPPAPSITACLPGIAKDSTYVDIYGTGFTDATNVLFGALSSTYTSVVDDTWIVAQVPPTGGSGTVDVTVQIPSGDVTLAKGFTYNQSASNVPSIQSISPTSGSPGTSVTITGTGFTWTYSVQFDPGLPSPSEASFTVLSDTTVQCVVPDAGVVSGTLAGVWVRVHAGLDDHKVNCFTYI
jgi:hypothetical protein